jgi:hypothetical protein
MGRYHRIIFCSTPRNWQSSNFWICTTIPVVAVPTTTASSPSESRVSRERGTLFGSDKRR